MNASGTAAFALGALLLTGATKAPDYHLGTPIALADGGWDLVSFDPVRRRLYVARTDSVTALDVDTGRVTAKLSPASRGHAVVPLNGGAELLETDGGTNTARFLNSMTGAEVAAVKVGENPDAALFDAATGLAVVMNAKSGTLSLLDPKSHKLVGEIAVGGALELGAVDGTGRLFVNVEDKGELVVVDLKARKVTARIALKGCEEPSGLAYLPLARRLMSSCGNGVAAVTDPGTGKVEALLPIGAGPDTVAYDGRRHVAMIPAGRAGELDLFADTAAGVKPLGKVASHLGARTGAVDEKTGRFYAPAADYEAAVPGERRPKMKPGSVRLVVVSPTV